MFGTEAILPTEVGLPTLTTLVAENVEENQRQLTRNLDLLEEVRECAQIRRAITKVRHDDLPSTKVWHDDPPSLEQRRAITKIRHDDLDRKSVV